MILLPYALLPSTLVVPFLCACSFLDDCCQDARAPSPAAAIPMPMFLSSISVHVPLPDDCRHYALLR